MNRLEAFRTEKDLDRAQIGEMIGVTARTVYNWETGRTAIPSDALIELAKYFQVTTDELLGLRVHK